MTNMRKLQSLRSDGLLNDDPGEEPGADVWLEFRESSMLSQVASNKLGEGHGKPHLQHSHGKSELPSMSNIELDNPAQSAWCQEPHVSQRMLALAPL